MFFGMVVVFIRVDLGDVGFKFGWKKLRGENVLVVLFRWVWERGGRLIFFEGGVGESVWFWEIYTVRNGVILF